MNNYVDRPITFERLKSLFKAISCLTVRHKGHWLAILDLLTIYEDAIIEYAIPLCSINLISDEVIARRELSFKKKKNTDYQQVAVLL